MGIREGGNVKKCRPVVKEPSGGTLLFRCALPARGASVRPALFGDQRQLCLGAACTGCILTPKDIVELIEIFASALPARGASMGPGDQHHFHALCLGAACTGCIAVFHHRRQRDGLCLGAACTGCITSCATSLSIRRPLPRRCLHGVHRQKPTNCGTPFCSIRRESVDSFSEINSKDSCADYFPALFCCQGDLHHHYRQPRTDNRPVLRCEQHRLFLFILSSHYRRLL